jgi:hypothetical protein
MQAAGSDQRLVWGELIPLLAVRLQDYGDALQALLQAHRSIVPSASSSSSSLQHTLSAVQLLLKYGAVVSDRPGLHQFLCEASPQTMMLPVKTVSTGMTAVANPWDALSEDSLKQVLRLTDRGASSGDWSPLPTEKGVKVEFQVPVSWQRVCFICLQTCFDGVNVV